MEKDEDKEKSIGEEKISAEEAYAKLKEELDKLTVRDIVLQMMVSLSSLAYEKMGFPKEVNIKKRDLAQSKLAIDCLSALVEACEKNLPQDDVSPFKVTVANLKMAYVKESTS